MREKYPLSIIIPIYNTEKYLTQCLKSIIQNFKFKIEIILVNDCSKDNSLNKLKSFLRKQKKFHKIKLINHKKNLGLGFSRNSGIKVATGYYIAFLDSDDLLLKEFSKTTCELIQKKNYDIIEYGFLRFNKIMNKKKYNHLYNFVGNQIYKKIKTDFYSKTVWYASIRIYKKKLWKNIKFPKLYYEDVDTIYKLYDRSKKIYFIDIPLLGYRYNPESITSKLSKKNYDDLIKVFNNINLKSNDISKKIMKIRIARSICYFKNYLKINDGNYQKIIKTVKKFKLPFLICIKLKIPDFLYFKFNSFYEFLDKLRFLYK